MSDLLTLIERAGEADLKEVREKIAQLESQLSGLHALRKVLMARLGQAPPPSKPGPKPDPKPKEGGQAEDNDREDFAKPKGWLREKYRRDAAKTLKTGPRRQKELCDECGIPEGSMTAVLESPWFRKHTDGMVYLTEDGRKAVG